MPTFGGRSGKTKGRDLESSTVIPAAWTLGVCDPKDKGQNVRLRQALTSASSHPRIQHSLSTYVTLLSGDASGRNLCKPLIQHEDAASPRIFVHRFEAFGLLQNLTSYQRHSRPATEICSAATRACTKPYETVRSHKAASPE